METNYIKYINIYKILTLLSLKKNAKSELKSDLLRDH